MTLRISGAHRTQGFVSFTLEELKGVPQDVISGYVKRTEGDKELYDVTHKTPDIFPLVCMRRGSSGDARFMKSSQFKYAQSAETRRRAYESFEARLELNAPLLDRALELRRNIATQLGYKTWADYVTEVKMVKSGDNVEKARPKYCNVAMLLTNVYSFWLTSSKDCALWALWSAKLSLNSKLMTSRPKGSLSTANSIYGIIVITTGCMSRKPFPSMMRS